ncbi:MAG: S-methyl-5'-thioadenosine phosphorylase [Candidatus Methanofastidiosia archaeon]
MYAIIGGSGIYDPEMISDAAVRSVDTPFGEVKVVCGKFKGIDIFFLSRHGQKHSVPPHMINYRANIWALKMIGVTRILSTSAVGSLQDNISPGNYVVLSDFLDFTKTRKYTFYEGKYSNISEKSVVHIDITRPYCPQLRNVLIKAGRELKLSIVSEGTYVCTEGPRFETAAEIRMYSQLGGDVVGMTNVPEAVLAREAEICYASVAMVTNFAAGISKLKLTHTEVLDIMEKNRESIKKLFKKALYAIPKKRDCRCADSLKGAKG